MLNHFSLLPLFKKKRKRKEKINSEVEFYYSLLIKTTSKSLGSNIKMVPVFGSIVWNTTWRRRTARQLHWFQTVANQLQFLPVKLLKYLCLLMNMAVIWLVCPLLFNANICWYALANNLVKALLDELPFDALYGILYETKKYMLYCLRMKRAY